MWALPGVSVEWPSMPRDVVLVPKSEQKTTVKLDFLKKAVVCVCWGWGVSSSGAPGS